MNEDLQQQLDDMKRQIHDLQNERKNLVNWPVSKLIVKELQFSGSTPYVADIGPFTSDQTYTITPGFTPRKIVAYGYAANTAASPFRFSTTSGSGDVYSATAGICNSYTLSFDSPGGTLSAYSLGTNESKLVMASGFTSTVYISITSWTDSSIILNVKVASNWQLAVVVSVTG